MSGTRRGILGGLGGVGLLLVAAPALAAEAADRATAGRAGVALTIVGGVGRIAGLDPLGPAARAGLRPGDMVTGWSGGALSGLPAALRGLAGEQIELTVVRAGARRTVRLVLEDGNLTFPP